MTTRRIAAVTGASRGIGRATAIALAHEGYRVFALARSRDDLQSLRREVPSRIVPVVVDVASDASRSEAIGAIMSETNGYGLDVLVNNAGYGQLGPTEETPIEKVRNQFEINVIGLVALTQPFLPGMRARGYGRVVNVSSAAGRISTPFMGPYSASKFAVEALSDALRVELAPFGVRVIVIEPGPIRTNFGKASDEAIALDSPYLPYLAGWNAAHGVNNLLERSPEAVARLIARTIRSSHPRARYTITLSARSATVARRLLPDIAMDWILGRAIRRGQ